MATPNALKEKLTISGAATIAALSFLLASLAFVYFVNYIIANRIRVHRCSSAANIMCSASPTSLRIISRRLTLMNADR